MEHVANRDRTGMGYQYLLRRAWRGEGGWRLLRRSKVSQQMEWMETQVRKYLSKERHFLRKLMVCMHITGEWSGVAVAVAVAVVVAQCGNCY